MTRSGDPELLHSTTTDRITTLCLDRPQVRNALNSALGRQLFQALREAERDDGVDVVILTGTDPAFCAGLDVKEFSRASRSATHEAVRVGASRRSSAVPSPWPTDMTKPVIAAVNGPAVAGGLELVLLCDFAIASERATFVDSHVDVGIMPGWGMSALLPQAIGLRAAKQLSLTGAPLSATAAEALGLVTRVVRHEELLDCAQQLAGEIGAKNQGAVRHLLRGYKRNALTTTADALRLESDAAIAWLSGRAVEQDGLSQLDGAGRSV